MEFLPGELVQGLFPAGRLSLTHVQSIGYAGFGYSRSQHVEFHFDDSVAEVLASQSALGHASGRVTFQLVRRNLARLKEAPCKDGRRLLPHRS